MIIEGPDGKDRNTHHIDDEQLEEQEDCADPDEACPECGYPATGRGCACDDYDEEGH